MDPFKAVCALALGASLLQIKGLHPSRLLGAEDFNDLATGLALQNHRVGSCRDVRVGLATLDRGKFIFIKGRDWKGDAFAKAQLLRNEGTAENYRPASRTSGQTVWIYNVSQSVYQTDIIDWAFTPHLLFGLQFGARGRLIDLKTRTGRSLCGSFSSERSLPVRRARSL